jgi:hypothetical protein
LEVAFVSAYLAWLNYAAIAIDCELDLMWFDMNLGGYLLWQA